MKCIFCKGEGKIKIKDSIGFGNVKSIECYACLGTGNLVKCKKCNGVGKICKFIGFTKLSERYCLVCMGNGYIPEMKR